MSTPASPTPPPTVSHPSTLSDCAVAGEPASTMAKAAITLRTILRVVRALLGCPNPPTASSSPVAPAQVEGVVPGDVSHVDIVA